MYEELVSHLRECAKLDPSENTFAEAADAIEDLSKTLDEEVEINTALGCNMPVWIPVTERLPKDGAEVLAFNKTGFAYVDCWADGKWKINSMVNEEHEIVTHWMPLPEPPKDGES